MKKIELKNLIRQIIEEETKTDLIKKPFLDDFNKTIQILAKKIVRGKIDPDCFSEMKSALDTMTIILNFAKLKNTYKEPTYNEIEELFDELIPFEQSKQYAENDFGDYHKIDYNEATVNKYDTDEDDYL